MKKVLLLVGVITFLSACGNSPYKKRKSCRGNGGWYGKRNLGAIDQHQKTTPVETYALKTKAETQL